MGGVHQGFVCVLVVVGVGMVPVVHLSLASHSHVGERVHRVGFGLPAGKAVECDVFLVESDVV